MGTPKDFKYQRPQHSLDKPKGLETSQSSKGRGISRLLNKSQQRRIARRALEIDENPALTSIPMIDYQEQEDGAQTSQEFQPEILWAHESPKQADQRNQQLSKLHESLDSNFKFNSIRQEEPVLEIKNRRKEQRPNGTPRGKNEITLALQRQRLQSGFTGRKQNQLGRSTDAQGSQGLLTQSSMNELDIITDFERILSIRKQQRDGWKCQGSGGTAPKSKERNHRTKDEP